MSILRKVQRSFKRDNKNILRNVTGGYFILDDQVSLTR